MRLPVPKSPTSCVRFSQKSYQDKKERPRHAGNGNGPSPFLGLGGTGQTHEAGQGRGWVLGTLDLSDLLPDLGRWRVGLTAGVAFQNGLGRRDGPVGQGIVRMENINPLSPLIADHRARSVLSGSEAPSMPLLPPVPALRSGDDATLSSCWAGQSG